MIAAGLTDFGPVQNNISFNDSVGTTRGIHAEPWDKFVSVAAGRIFGAWVDLREGATFGAVFTAEIDPSRAVFVPRGVGNGFQTLEPGTVYSYLVNDHWTAAGEYAALNLGDEKVGIQWPIPLVNAELSDKDRAHPPLEDVVPVRPRKILVLGADGQLGQALRETYRFVSHVDFATRSDITLGVTDLCSARRWREYDAVINAAAYTAVDRAETSEGRMAAWAANVKGVSDLAKVAAQNGITLIHISSDYVFDGTSDRPYREDDPMAPLGVYGQTKAAGDQIVTTVPRHYVVRTSWVIGAGHNFVRTMVSLAERGVDPGVVDDQRGRLTFTVDIAGAVRHLLDSGAPYGTYNVTGSGPVMSWADIAKRVFRFSGHDSDRVTPVTTSKYYANAAGPIAPRPCNSALELKKIEAVGFVAGNVDARLKAYIESALTESC
ncbi:dTDP-4-dehydrorhamnose reductase [Mycolicibacterium aurum]|uniref:dTDP-4-dehydrorhamnose reductase n=2 Tax=Mycolicibacterium aurum TaxID=1791 RepID=A0A3S4SFP6_MYCAU|nr:dTDP-4-dehydrorhamnose reductase [Mycolicibacterium aurum]